MNYIGYLSNFLEFANTNLSNPVSRIQNLLGLKTNTVETKLTPINYGFILVVIIYLIVNYANSLISNLVGIIYPAIYSMNIFNSEEANNERLITLNKYWILFGLLTVIDGFFGWILHLIPGYFYFKIAFIYFLIRNDFYLTNTAYERLNKSYVDLRIEKRINELIALIKSKLNLN
jgi:hypothetical protein